MSSDDPHEGAIASRRGPQQHFEQGLKEGEMLKTGQIMECDKVLDDDESQFERLKPHLEDSGVTQQEIDQNKNWLGNLFLGRVVGLLLVIVTVFIAVFSYQSDLLASKDSSRQLSEKTDEIQKYQAPPLMSLEVMFQAVEPIVEGETETLDDSEPEEPSDEVSPDSQEAAEEPDEEQETVESTEENPTESESDVDSTDEEQTESEAVITEESQEPIAGTDEQEESGQESPVEDEPADGDENETNEETDEEPVKELPPLENPDPLCGDCGPPDDAEKVVEEPEPEVCGDCGPPDHEHDAEHVREEVSDDPNEGIWFHPEMILLDDLDCVCPSDLEGSKELIHRPFSQRKGRPKNIVQWLKVQAKGLGRAVSGQKNKEQFLDPDGCLCTLPVEEEFEPHVNIDRFEEPSAKQCFCDPLPPSILKYMHGVKPMGFTEDGEECVCHDMGVEEEEELEPHVDIDRFEEPSELECFCEPLPESVLKYMQGAVPMGVDSEGNECACHDMQEEEPEEEELEPHVNIDRFDEPTYDEEGNSLECFCDPIPESIRKYMHGALPMGVDSEGNECVCHDMYEGEMEEELEPHVNIDRFEEGGSASSHEVDCFCDPFPESVLKYMKGALPMGVDANGDECVCYEFEVIPDDGISEPTQEEEEVPSAPSQQCVAEPDYNTVTYDKCQMEKSMYRAIFHLSDVDNDQQVTYEDMLQFLEGFNFDVDEMKSQFKELDTDDCGYATWLEIREFSLSTGYSQQGSDAQVVLYQYLDQFGNQNGVLTEHDWTQGVDLLNSWKEQFYYNLDMLVAMMDQDENGLVNIEEMEAVVFDICELWNTEEPVEPENEEEEEPVEPEEVCDPEPAANSVTYDFCLMEEELFKAFFHLSDQDDDGVTTFSDMVILYQVFEPTMAELTDSFNQADTDGCGFVTWEKGQQILESRDFSEKDIEAQMTINKIGDMYGNSNGVLTVEDWEMGLEQMLLWKNQIFKQLLLNAEENGITGDKQFTVDELDQYVYYQCQSDSEEEESPEEESEAEETSDGSEEESDPENEGETPTEEDTESGSEAEEETTPEDDGSDPVAADDGTIDSEGEGDESVDEGDTEADDEAIAEDDLDDSEIPDEDLPTPQDADEVSNEEENAEQEGDTETATEDPEEEAAEDGESVFQEENLPEEPESTDEGTEEVNGDESPTQDGEVKLQEESQEP